jgi:DNA repair exonuclease SbcCD ATPase subunit
VIVAEERIGEAVAHNATNDLKRIAAFARGLIALDAEVSRIGSLEGAIREAQARLEQVRAQEAADKQASSTAIEEFSRQLEDLKHQVAEEVGARVEKLAQLDGYLAVKGAELERVTGELATARAEYDRVVSSHREFVAGLTKPTAAR